jgi:ABC-type multidrug transport system fused ATPase/permease subunit
MQHSDLVAVGAMVWVSPTLTMLMMGVVPPVSLGAVVYGRYIKKLSNQTQEAVGEMTKAATESLSALRTVQAFNALPQEELRFHEKVSNVITLARKEAIASGIFFGSTGWSGNVTILCLLGYGNLSMQVVVGTILTVHRQAALLCPGGKYLSEI